MSGEKKELETINIYQMSLHDVLRTEENKPSDMLATSVMRVPGGWIYRSFDKSHNMMSSTFVPFHNEFQQQDTQQNKQKCEG
jgi:hypothetical protein